jgi:hypothetical protein
MITIKYNDGGQPFLNDDDELQQDELFKAIERQFEADGAFVISGCVVTGNSISSGLVYIDGKIREVIAQSNLSFPCYIRALPVYEYDIRLHEEDQQQKTTKRAFLSQIETQQPVSGQFITITANGSNKRLARIFRNDSNGLYTVSGAQLNAGTVTSVKATRAQVIGFTGNTVISGYSKLKDTLNEFDNSTGLFTASEAGIYIVSASVRVDYTANPIQYAVTIESNESGSFTSIGYVLFAIIPAFTQMCVPVVALAILSAGNKLRIRLDISTSSSSNYEVSDLSIARHS